MKTKEVPKNSLTFCCDNIKSAMKLHSIFTSNKNNLTTLMVKDLACFCYLCIDKSGFDYPNLHSTGDWVPKVLQLVDTRSICRPMYDD